MQTWAVSGLAVLAGLALGSFTVTFALRLARGDGALRGRSRCDGCGHGLGYVQTLPLVSYIRLHGACSLCQGRIDPLHPTGEALGAMIVASSLLAVEPLRVALLSSLGLLLLAAATVDLKVRRLPDVLTGAIAAVALIHAGLRGWDEVVEGLAAGAIAAAGLLALRWAHARRKGDPGLGLGDVKLIAALGLWLGVAISWLIGLSAAIGLAWMAVVRPKDGRLAFGPPVAISAWIIGLSQEVVRWPMMM